MKIRLAIALFDKAIYLQILYQDPISCDGNMCWTASNNVTILSSGQPQIDSTSSNAKGGFNIYLRGTSRMHDLDVVRQVFKSNDERDAYFSRMMDAIEEWAEKWTGWKNAKNDEKSVKDKLNAIDKAKAMEDVQNWNFTF
jgi:hypothetical protein